MPLLSFIPEDVVWLVFAAVLLLTGGVIGFALGLPARGRERAAQAERDAARAEAEGLRSQIEETQTELAARQDAAGRVSILEDKLAAAGRLAAQGERVPGLEAELAALRDQVGALTAENARLAEAPRDAEAGHAERLLALTALREDVEARMAVLVDDALRRNQTALVDVAQQLLESHKRAADVELQAAHGAIDGLVKPVAETLEKCEQRLTVLEQGTTKIASTPSARTGRRDRSRSSQRATAQRVEHLEGREDGLAPAGGGRNGAQEPVEQVDGEALGAVA